MNYLPPMLVKVKQLVLPGDIKARQKQPHVVELAESIRERTGKRPIHLPTIEYPSKELIAGRDRVAACLLNGNKSVWVQPVSQLTPADRRNLERDENLHRRVDDRDKLIRQRVGEAAAEIEAQRILEGATERKPGRPKSAKGEAREQVARELGTTPDAVRVAEARAIEVEEATEEPATPPPPPVETYGLPLVSDGESAEIAAYQDAIDDADRLLRRAQATLGGIDGGPFAGAAQRLVAAVHQVAADVRAARPAAVCPYCKRLPALVGNPGGCPGCGGVGFVSADAMLGVADELKLGGARAMAWHPGGRPARPGEGMVGGLVPYSEPHPIIDRHSRAAKATAPAKKVTVMVTDDDGETVPWDET